MHIDTVLPDDRKKYSEWYVRLRFTDAVNTHTRAGRKTFILLSPSQPTPTSDTSTGRTAGGPPAWSDHCSNSVGGPRYTIVVDNTLADQSIIINSVETQPYQTRLDLHS